MPTTSQESPASTKTPNLDLKDMYALCTSKIKREGQNSKHGGLKDQLPYQNKYQNAKPPSGVPSISENPNQDIKDTDVLCTFKTKIESQNSNHGCIKDK